jgi:hypothetical protein
MLNTYHRGVYYQLTEAAAFANLTPVLADDYVSKETLTLDNT